MELPPKKSSVHHIKIPSNKPMLKSVDEAISVDKQIRTVVTDAAVTVADEASQTTDIWPVRISSANEFHDDYQHELRKHIGEYTVVLGNLSEAYISINDKGNPYLVRVGSKTGNHFLRKIAQKRNVRLTARDLKETNETLKAYAEMELEPVDIYLRIAPYKNGVEIDHGDDEHTRTRITPGKIKTVRHGSETLFYRTNVTLPFVTPAKKGNLNKLRKYLKNIRPDQHELLIGWISYTLAHPKVSSTNFVILALIGGQGTGKSFLCKLIARLIDPSQVGLQILPKNSSDLVVSAKNAQVLFYDNTRQISQTMSDALCVCATGGSLSKRQLFTDGDQYISILHAALVLNGIYDFITESDLAQRSLTLHLLDMDESDRLSERDLEHQLEQDLPEILQGLFELIAEVLKHLPDVEISYPERMIDFSRWLAAMEVVNDFPAGAYQYKYSECLKEAQMSTLLENPLASEVYQFADNLRREWKGRPSELLQELNDRAHFSAQRSPDWPKSPESLSKRLKVITAALRSQGIFITFTRGKHRQITITTTNIEDQY